jgi:hypothetical protein
MNPNRELWQAGAALMDYIGLNYQHAMMHLSQELSICDGYPAGNDEPNVTATSELTSVERAANARLTITTCRDDLEAQRAETLAHIRILNEMCTGAQQFRTPKVVTEPDSKKACCATGQVGKEGAIEWGDPLCLMPQVKGGMCQAHYYRWYRHRQEHGIDTSKDFEPA